MSLHYLVKLESRVLWKFKITQLLSSQDSVETLFMWGGKHLYYFLANFFSTLCTRFYQNQSSFM